MAQVEGNNKGRSSNAELNLIPFIDLMSVLITFLLITAVWSQVSMIQIGSSLYGKQTSQDFSTPPPMADIPMRLDVKANGFRLVFGRDTFNYPKSGATYDTVSLTNQLRGIKLKYKEKTDVVITVDDDVNYEFLILGMDLLIQSGFPAISVSTGGSV